MAINETISKGNKYRRLKDNVNKVWQRISFWTAASDVEFDNGQTAQEALGNITGITDSLTSNSSAVAASANAVSQLNSNLNSVSNARYIENGRINVYVGSDDKLHFVNRDGADTVLNFNSKPTISSGTFSISGTNGDSVGATVNIGFEPDVLVYYVLNDGNARVMGFWKTDFGNNFIFYNGEEGQLNVCSRVIASSGGYWKINRGALGSITNTGFTVYGTYVGATGTYWACKYK